jgi:hypothetical protein
MRASWWDWRHVAVRIRGFRSKYAHYYGSDVVISAVDVCFLDEGVHDSLGLRPRQQ